jgi:hypothetical protein
MTVRLISLIEAAKGIVSRYSGRTMPIVNETSISNTDVGLPPELSGSDHCG